jgi:PAS domain S-box-containing protein
MSNDLPTFDPRAVTREKWRFGGLFWKFLLILTPLFLILAVPGIGLLVDYQLRQGQEALSARIGNQAGRAADALAHHQGARNRRLAQDLLAPLASDRAFLCAEVRNSTNGRLQFAQPQLSGCKNTTDGYALTLPVGDSENELLVRFTDIEIRKAERLQSTVSISVVGLAFILAVIASMVGFRVIVNQPLNLLIKAIRHSAETGEKSQVDYQPRDELGTVIAAYNNLLVREAERDAALTQSKKMLEESEALRQSEERYRRLVAVSPDGVIVHTNAKIVFANETIANILGAPSPEFLIGRSMDSLVPPREMAQVKARRKNIENGAEIGLQERLLLRLDGSEFPVEHAVARIHWEGTPSNLLLIRDITHRKDTEKELLRNQRLAEAASKAKSEFLANMSHELRTPLNAVIGFSQMIRKQVYGEIGDPRYREFAKDIEDSGQHLLGIISDILDLSKIEAGMIDLEDQVVEISAVIETVMSIIATRAELGDVDLIRDIPDTLPQLRVDPLRFKQILINLLSNGIKFTEKGGTVTVRVRCDGDDGFIFQIVDTGIGMTPEEITTALTRFGQVDGHLSRRFEGTGLGLPLTKELVELHGGKLYLDSRPKTGTTATVSFPANRIAIPDTLSRTNAA